MMLQSSPVTLKANYHQFIYVFRWRGWGVDQVNVLRQYTHLRNFWCSRPNIMHATLGIQQPSHLHWLSLQTYIACRIEALNSTFLLSRNIVCTWIYYFHETRIFTYPIHREFSFYIKIVPIRKLIFSYPDILVANIYRLNNLYPLKLSLMTY